MRKQDVTPKYVDDPAGQRPLAMIGKKKKAKRKREERG
jgi:hypothetical protein